jgi:hypothetical protein
MAVIIFKLINVTDESEVSSFVSKAGIVRTYKEIIQKKWKPAFLNNSFTEVHPILPDGRPSKKITGVYLHKNAWIETGLKDYRIDVFSFDGKPDLMNDTDLSTFLSKVALPDGKPVKKLETKAPVKKVALAAKKTVKKTVSKTSAKKAIKK